MSGGWGAPDKPQSSSGPVQGPGSSMGPPMQNGGLEMSHHLMQQGNKGLVNHMQNQGMNTPASQGLINSQGKFFGFF